MTQEVFHIRKARPEEFEAIGKLMVRVYTGLEGFPKESAQPEYYQLLRNVGTMTEKPGVSLLVAISNTEELAGTVLFFGDIKHYGSGGIATSEPNAAGFRLLAVDDRFRGNGIGKLLTGACIDQAKTQGRVQLILHTTHAMQTAWKMYERMGFVRSPELDFMQSDLAVRGFRMTFTH